MAVQVSLSLFHGLQLRRPGLPTAFTYRIFQSRCASVSTTEKETSRSASESQNDVALAIANCMALTESKDSNLVFSPLLIQVILSLVAAGSKGATQDQLLSFLKCKAPTDLYAFASELVPLVFATGRHPDSPRLSFANAVWLEKTLHLKPSFKEIVDTVFKAAVHPADFQSKAAELPNAVNSWIKKKTDGLITRVLPPGSVTPDTRLIFANALYFKGIWAKKFDETVYYDFNLLNGGSVRVPFMTNKKRQLIGTFDGFQVLQLSYREGRGDKRSFSMYVFLPDAKDGLPALIDRVGSDSAFLDYHLQHLREVRVRKFRIPKFKISFSFEASNVLKELGLELPFADGGLTEMVDSPQGQLLFVKSIFQKAFIEVNEEGTEAVAASACCVELRCRRVYKETDFVADHPFLFVIQENSTGLILFIGHVLNPLAV